MAFDARTDPSDLVRSCTEMTGAVASSLTIVSVWMPAVGDGVAKTLEPSEMPTVSSSSSTASAVTVMSTSTWVVLVGMTTLFAVAAGIVTSPGTVAVPPLRNSTTSVGYPNGWSSRTVALRVTSAPVPSATDAAVAVNSATDRSRTTAVIVVGVVTRSHVRPFANGWKSTLANDPTIGVADWMIGSWSPTS